MDVLCVGMYRACSTWQYEVIAHLLEKHRGAQRLGYLTGDQYAAMGRRDGHAPGAWRVLKSHEEHGSFARALAEGRAIAVYAHRDVRDVVYSLMHKRQANFDTILRNGMVHQILANDRFWSSRPRLITQRYDHLISDPATGVSELAAHLELELSPGEAGRVAAEYSFQANRKRTEDLGRKLADGGIDLADPAVAQAHDRQTLLHWNHMREGRVGDWRDRATPQERAILARICGPWLARHGYEPDDLRDLDATSLGGAAGAIRRELAMARGSIACRLRTQSLRRPRLARAVKTVLGIPIEPPLALPAPIPEGVRRDEAGSSPAPHRDAIRTPHR